jgi:hypothetical protein
LKDAGGPSRHPGAVLGLQSCLAGSFRRNCEGYGENISEDSALQRQDHHTRHRCWHVRCAPARTRSKWCGKPASKGSAVG